MKKVAFAALLCAGLAAQSVAQTIYFSDSFVDLSQWTSKPGGPSYASVSGGVLSFSNANSGGDIYSTNSYTAAFINFDYLGTASAVGGGFIGVSPTLGGTSGGVTDWLAGAANPDYSTPITLTNDGSWQHYSFAFGSGHISVEQFYNTTGGQAQFRNLSLSDVALAAVPEPETYAMLLAGLGLMACITRRRRQHSVTL